MQQLQGFSCAAIDVAISSPHGMSAIAAENRVAACCNTCSVACAGTTSVEAIKVMITSQCTRRETRRGMDGILVLTGGLRPTARLVQ